MATIAESLLNDFEDSDDEQNGDLYRDEENLNNTRLGGEDGIAVDANDDTHMEDDEDEDESGQQLKFKSNDIDDEEDAKAQIEKMQLKGVQDVRNVAGLMKQIQPVLEKIAHFQAIPPEKRTTHMGSIEDNPEYKLLTQSNTLSTQIDSEIVLVNKFIRDHYSIRFPELESLVENPLDYAKTVAILKNGPLDNIKAMAGGSDDLVGQPLRSFLDGPTLMVVTVEGSRSRGVEMSDAELATTMRACEMTLALDKAKKTLTGYVQSLMDIFAPNLTKLIGSLTAAQLLGFAGGLKGLAKTPDRNVPAMGSRKQKQSGLATNVGIRQQGFLYHSKLIQDVKTDLKIQAMRIVSAKLVLAARVDLVHESPDGSTGELLLNECERRIQKLEEAPPNRGQRALPAPDDKLSRKRGGRRARKAKEATAMTELRKQQNRMAFGKEEKEVGYGTGDTTKGLGMIGQENDGRIRATQIDRRTMAKLSKKNQGWGGGASGLTSSLNNVGGGGLSSSLRPLGASGSATSLRAQGLRSSGVNTKTGGMASSIVFGPVQGLELVDPKIQAELKRKREAENAGYFSSGTFTHIGGGSTKRDGDGFKIPGLPPAKKSNTGR